MTKTTVAIEEVTVDDMYETEIGEEESTEQATTEEKTVETESVEIDLENNIDQTTEIKNYHSEKDSDTDKLLEEDNFEI